MNKPKLLNQNRKLPHIGSRRRFPNLPTFPLIFIVPDHLRSHILRHDQPIVLFSNDRLHIIYPFSIMNFHYIFEPRIAPVIYDDLLLPNFENRIYIQLRMNYFVLNTLKLFTDSYNDIHKPFIAV